MLVRRRDGDRNAGRNACEIAAATMSESVVLGLLLNGWTFDSLLEAQVLIEDWRIDYNTNRPHSAHGGLTPTEFAQACVWMVWPTR